MSGFKDTFTKQETDENLLDYDDSAFYYFATVLLVCILLPLAYSFCMQALIGTFDPETPFIHAKTAVIKTCRCADCHTRHKGVEKKRAGRVRKFGVRAVVQLVLIVAIIYLIFVLLDWISKAPEGIKPFDPFEILAITPDATDKEIKSAFRKMSLKYHPDKNPGDNIAAGRFIQASKAYEALTSELARKNYEKYGNPDGPSPMKVAIGLPRFLLNTENHVIILVVFFAILLVLVPASVMYFMSRGKTTDKNGVLVENTRFFAGTVSENMTHKKILLLIAAAPEFVDTKSTKETVAEIASLKRLYEEFIPTKKPLHPRVIKNYLILLAHMMRKKLGPVLKKDLEHLLNKAGSLIETMTEVSFILSMQGSKRMSVDAVSFMLDISQLLTQAMWMHDSNLLMLPHTNSINLKDFKLGKKGRIQMLDDNTTEALKSKFSESHFLDIQETLRFIPAMKVTAIAKVDSEENDDVITEGDVVTVVVTIERLHLKEGEEVGLVHAPFQPRCKYEKLWLFVIEPEKRKMVFLKQYSSVERVITEDKIKFQVGAQCPPYFLCQGIHKWEVIVKSDSYYDIDATAPLEFTVLPNEAVKKDVFVHPDDLELDKHPTWFQQVMGNKLDEDTESSDEEDSAMHGLEEIKEKADEEGFDEVE
jgi:translocation protein SEC63